MCKKIMKKNQINFRSFTVKKNATPFTGSRFCFYVRFQLPYL